MRGSPASFECKAPFVDVDAIRDLIVYDIVSDGTREQAESIWLQNSFVDPDCGIDENESPSDLDIFILIPDWNLPVADTGIAVATSETRVPAIYEQVGPVTWESKDGRWTDSVDEFWEHLPEHVQQTLVQSMHKGFYATEEDYENRLIRSYDVTIGDRTAFNYERDAHARVEIWPTNELSTET